MRKQMINRSAVSAFVLVSTLMLGFSPLAQAACQATDIKGIWTLNGAYWTPVSDVAADIGWFTCKIQMNKDGKINANQSSCKDENGATTPITAGRLQVKQSCRVSGPIKFGGGTNIDVSNGQMSPDGQEQISATGKLSNGPREYLMTFTRRP